MMAAIAGVDIALWDLKAQSSACRSGSSSGQPSHRAA